MASKKSAPAAAKSNKPTSNTTANANSGANGHASAKNGANGSSANSGAASPAPVKHPKGYTFDTTGFDKETVIDWYRLMHLGRKLDEKAANYLKLAKGW